MRESATVRRMLSRRPVSRLPASLAVFVETYRPPVAVRMYAGGFRRDGDLVSVPLYGLERLPAFLAEATRAHPSGAPLR